MLSEDERDIDVDSDDDQNSYRGGDPSNKRAHHNALERKRRDHIKDSFCKLRDAIPAMQGDKLSRAQILKKASEYILSMRKKNSTHQKDVDDLKRQNSHLEAQIRALERAKTQGNFSSVSDILNQSGLSGNPVAVQQENSSDDLASYDIGSDSQDSSDVYSVSGHSLLQSASSAIEPPTKKGKPDQKNSNNQDSGFKKRIV